MKSVNDVGKVTGRRFEIIVKKTFPEFTDLRKRDNMPDFGAKGFYVESKVSFSAHDYGIAPKQYQIDRFSFLDNPVVYLCGFHNIKNARAILNQQTWEGQLGYTRKNMQIVGAYFVSSSIISAIWNRDMIISGKVKERYCRIPISFIEKIIKNTGKIQRGEDTFTISEFLNLDLGEYELQLAKKGVHGFPYGWIIHREKEESVLEFLKS